MNNLERIAFALWALVAVLILAAFAFCVGGLEAAEPVTLPGYLVGEFKEPPARVLTHIGGKDHVTLSHLWLKGKEIRVPVAELRLVAPSARQTRLGPCAGAQAARQGSARSRNRAFYRNPRVACAAFTAFCMRHCGRPGMSFAVTQQYAQVRKRGARVVAAKISTRYAPYYPYYKRGDLLFFHKSGGRMGHVEFCVGGGWTVGTSSSAGYVAKRRVGNRGFARMTVVRL